MVLVTMEILFEVYGTIRLTKPTIFRTEGFVVVRFIDEVKVKASGHDVLVARRPGRR